MKKLTAKTYYILASLSAGISIAALIYLAQQHWALKLGLDVGQSLCNLNDRFNCDAVNTSRFSSLGGIPIALWGSVAFVIYWITSSLGYFGKLERMQRHSYYLATSFVAVSALMAVLSFFVLQTYCLFCIATYLGAIGAFVAAKNLNPAGFSRLSQDLIDLAGESKGYLSIYVLIPLASFVIQDMSYGQNLKQLDEAVGIAISDYSRSKVYQFSQAPNHIIGASDADAKMQLVEFADFLCPHCKFASPTLKAFLARHPDVQLRFYHFPLSSACNSAIGGPGADRCRLARVSYCAEKEFGRGAEVTKELFEGQGFYRDANVIAEISKKLGLAQETLAQCEAAAETNAAIFAQAKMGEQAEIRGTPALFVNGRKLNFGIRLPILEGLYQSLKEKAL